jgi:hypothetical protein
MYVIAFRNRSLFVFRARVSVTCIDGGSSRTKQFLRGEGRGLVAFFILQLLMGRRSEADQQLLLQKHLRPIDVDRVYPGAQDRSYRHCRTHRLVQSLRKRAVGALKGHSKNKLDFLTSSTRNNQLRIDILPQSLSYYSTVR